MKVNDFNIAINNLFYEYDLYPVHAETGVIKGGVLGYGLDLNNVLTLIFDLRTKPNFRILIHSSIRKDGSNILYESSLIPDLERFYDEIIIFKELILPQYIKQ